MKSNEYKDKKFTTNTIVISQQPGITQVQYTPGLQVKDDNVTSKTLYFTFTAGTALGVQSYTGFGFTPSAYIIDAWLLDTNSSICISKGTRFNGVNGGFTAYPSTYSNISTRAIAIYSNSASTIRTLANFSQFLSDGIELDFIDNDVNIAFTITAFK